MRGRTGDVPAFFCRQNSGATCTHLAPSLYGCEAEVRAWRRSGDEGPCARQSFASCGSSCRLEAGRSRHGGGNRRRVTTFSTNGKGRGDGRRHGGGVGAARGRCPRDFRGLTRASRGARGIAQAARGRSEDVGLALVRCRPSGLHCQQRLVERVAGGSHSRAFPVAGYGCEVAVEA